MNRLAIRNLVEESIGRTDGSKASLVNSAIDLAVSKISLARFWRQLQVSGSVSLLINDTSVALATDAVRVTEIRVNDGTNWAKKLPIRPKEWVVRRWPDVSILSVAPPTVGYIEDKTLHVIPGADQGYTIAYTYFRLHPALATDSDSPLIDGIDAAIISYAVYWAFKTLQQLEDAKLSFQSYKDELADAINVDKLTVEEIFASPWNEQVPAAPNWWNDPFQRSMP